MKAFFVRNAAAIQDWWHRNFQWAKQSAATAPAISGNGTSSWFFSDARSFVPPAPTIQQPTTASSDVTGTATVTDPKLINPWGIVAGPGTPFWIADNNAGASTLYTGTGAAFPGAPASVSTRIVSEFVFRI